MTKSCINYIEQAKELLAKAILQAYINGDEHIAISINDAMSHFIFDMPDEKRKALEMDLEITDGCAYSVAKHNYKPYKVII